MVVAVATASSPLPRTSLLTCGTPHTPPAHVSWHQIRAVATTQCGHAGQMPWEKEVLVNPYNIANEALRCFKSAVHGPTAEAALAMAALTADPALETPYGASLAFTQASADEAKPVTTSLLI